MLRQHVKYVRRVGFSFLYRAGSGNQCGTVSLFQLPSNPVVVIKQLITHNNYREIALIKQRLEATFARLFVSSTPPSCRALA